jgi:murein L,D-transpeptidase YcbB/YkuD
MRPALRQYDALRSMLARYRSLAADATLRPPEFPSSVVHPGDRFAGAATLRRWLAAVGDVPPNVTASTTSEYSPDLVDAIQRFQQRHGLETDGVLGKATVAALQVPLAWRARQIEFALERLRWLPDFTDAPLVVVNIPMFRLWAWDSAPPTEPPALTTGVIVGRALNTQTPVFVEQMRQVIFRPYWNVPDSILRGEILPKLARDPQYLRRQNMEIVRQWDDDARAIDGGEGTIQALRRGELRVRQRPGPENSLGLVKFVFPNTNNVYMHGTPAQELFARSRRDFSHGCVRVEDPLTLAEWALRDEPEWSREAIQAAMGGARTMTVTLRRPIQVILFYTTAAVMPEDGTVHFADDIYRHDARLDQSLGDRTGPPTVRR